MEQLESVGLPRAGTRMPNELSGSMRKRAGLARAMVRTTGTSHRGDASGGDLCEHRPREWMGVGRWRGGQDGIEQLAVALGHRSKSVSVCVRVGSIHVGRRHR
jgi:hypothetical protein